MGTHILKPLALRLFLNCLPERSQLYSHQQEIWVTPFLHTLSTPNILFSSKFLRINEVEELFICMSTHCFLLSFLWIFKFMSFAFTLKDIFSLLLFIWKSSLYWLLALSNPMAPDCHLHISYQCFWCSRV